MPFDVKSKVTSSNCFEFFFSAQVEQSMLEQDLRSLLDLGAATKAFLLALAKTGRLKVVEKNIVFLNTA